MLLTVFEKYIFLQSLGWGIANSLWQGGLLWVIYKAVILSSRQVSALFKYHFSLALLFSSFAWFVSTILQNYVALQKTGHAGFSGWISVSDNFISSLQWLSVAYFIVLFVHICRFIKELKGLFFLKNNDLLKAPVEIRLFAEQTAFHIGIKKPVGIWLSAKASVPSVMGFFKPVILLPVTALNHLTTTQAEAVILHELAHIRRNDYLLNIIQSVTGMLLFFNPFARLLGDEARKERENCCDDWVMNYQYNKHDYAAALLALESNRFAHVQFALAATNGKKNLLSRVKRLFSEEPCIQFSFIQKTKLMAVSCSLLALAFFALPLSKVKNVVMEDYTGPAPLVANTAIPVAASYSENKKLSIIFRDDPQQTEPAPAPVRPIKNKLAAPVAECTEVYETVPDEIEVNTALINEDLIKQQQASAQLQAMAAIQAANKEQAVTVKVLVKVEEEQSGVKDKKVYLAEVSNENGTTAVKPLLILDKKIKPAANKPGPLSTKKAVAKKKQVTI